MPRLPIGLICGRQMSRGCLTSLRHHAKGVTEGSVAISATELFTAAVDYPYSSARNWVGEGKGLVEIDKDFGWLKEY